MPRAGQKILQSLKDIQAKKHRTITFTADGTVIIADPQTGASASGHTLKAANASWEEMLDAATKAALEAEFQTETQRPL